MKDYKFILLDHCHPDYFSGHHLPVIQVPVYSNKTAKQVLTELEDECNETGFYPDDQVIKAIEAFKKEFDLRKTFVTGPEEQCEDECPYLFFVIGQIEQDILMPSFRYAVNDYFDK